MRTNLIAGTAGHIDHGKTALVRALTGVDTDRLAEEKARGISIDLGFAHLDLASGVHIGLVDVPGHERFVRNMLAGVGGIDFVLFVVAANESIKPQTREHFDICRLLRIERGIVVLTKADLAGPDMVELVRMEFEEFAAGSFLEGAPVAAVSSTTGDGIEHLKTEIGRLAATIPPKSSNKRARLPVDRAFSIKGFGTVATGTLYTGAIQAGQELQLHPSGERVRVRGLQVHGRSAERAVAGQRTAVNLAGVEASLLRRGTVLAEPGVLQSTTRFDAELELLPSAKPLKHQAPVHLHAGAAVIEAEVRLLSQTAPVEPGGTAMARIVLREPALLLPGDRFIIRMFSPVTTIGGGTVLDIDPPVRLRRAQTMSRLRTLLRDDPTVTLALLVRESRFGLTADAIAARTGWTSAEIEKTGAKQPRLGSNYVDEAWAADVAQQIRTTVMEYHRQHPLAAGMSREDLRSRLLADAPAELFEALLHQTRELVVEGEHIRSRSHHVSLAADEEAALRQIEQAFAEAGLAVPATPEVLAKSNVGKDRAKTLLAMLLKQKRLMRAADDLIFHTGAIHELAARLASRKGQKFSVPEFKDWTGVSRKYAIPLLELLDRERITRREGDGRVVL
ncbi:MAG: selenocysteine-specific translation elongation factor [Acidobacteria bacterium]|nr:selenocysteine-specific translation elongation factor [Acidobacteriota bacterium]